MEPAFEFEGLTIKMLELEREIHFEVFDNGTYICRLVPGEAGFELSKLDKAIGNNPPQDFIVKISDFIVRKYA